LVELKVRGFSLGGYAYGEGDRLVLFYTLERGRVKVSAPGARRTGSKFSAISELFNESELSLARRPNGEVFRLLQGRLLDARPALKSGLPSLASLQFLADILRQAIPDDEPQPELYAALLGVLDRMVPAGDHPEAALASFIVRFLLLGGYPLILEKCVQCGGGGVGGGRLSARRGGFVCAGCHAPAAEGPEIGGKPLDVLRFLQSEGTGRLPAASRIAAREAFRSVASYLLHILERDLPTLGYFLRVTQGPDP
jgi:DNA repair protein RecO (recombination protein O)